MSGLTGPGGRRVGSKGTGHGGIIAAAVAAFLAGILVAATPWWPALPGTPALTAAAVAELDLVAQAPAHLAAAVDYQPIGFSEMEQIAVRLRNIGCGSLSTGSGFALDEYTLVTNKHVVAGAAEIQVSTFDGRDIEVKAVSSATFADLALVRTADPLPFFPRLAADDLKQGEAVMVVGFPAGGQLTTTHGNILGEANDPLRINADRVLATDAAVAPGSSGSPVFNEQGEVGGVVYAKSDTEITLLVPVTTLRALLADAGSFTPMAQC